MSQYLFFLLYSFVFVHNEYLCWSWNQTSLELILRDDFWCLYINKYSFFIQVWNSEDSELKAIHEPNTTAPHSKSDDNNGILSFETVGGIERQQIRKPTGLDEIWGSVYVTRELFYSIVHFQNFTDLPHYYVVAAFQCHAIYLCYTACTKKRNRAPRFVTSGFNLSVIVISFSIFVQFYFWLQEKDAGKGKKRRNNSSDKPSPLIEMETISEGMNLSKGKGENGTLPCTVILTFLFLTCGNGMSNTSRV